MKKILPWLIAVLLLGGGAFAYWRYSEAHKTPDIEFKTVAAEKRTIVGRVTASGTLQAVVTVQVGTQVSGRVSHLFKDFNSTVKKGEVIAKIDPQLFQAAVAQAYAQFVSAKAGVVKAEAQAHDAERVMSRAKLLNKDNLMSQADLESAQTSLEVANAGIDVAKASLAQSSASLNQAQVNLSYTIISSPIDGVVISRSVDVGQTVAASLSAPVLFTIAEDLKKMKVDTSVAEGDVGRLQPDMSSYFTVDAFPGQRFRGKVSQIRNSPTTVQNVVTYDAVIDFDNADLKLRPGMTANVTLIYAQKPDVLSVPNSALRFRPPPEVAGSASATATGSAAKAGGSSAVASASASPGDDAGAHASPTPTPAPTGRGRRGQSGAPSEPSARTVWVLRGTTATPIELKTGLSDGSWSEVLSGDLAEGDQLIIDAMVGGKVSAPAGAPPGGGTIRRMF